MNPLRRTIDFLKRLILKKNAIEHNENIAHQEKIAALAKQKLLADMKNEPWVAVVDVGMNEEGNGVAMGTMELDWNKAFIAELITNGYSGKTEDELVDQWFRDVCRGVLQQSEELPDE